MRQACPVPAPHSRHLLNIPQGLLSLSSSTGSVRVSGGLCVSWREPRAPGRAGLGVLSTRLPVLLWSLRCRGHCGLSGEVDMDIDCIKHRTALSCMGCVLGAPLCTPTLLRCILEARTRRQAVAATPTHPTALAWRFEAPGGCVWPRGEQGGAGPIFPGHLG